MANTFKCLYLNVLNVVSIRVYEQLHFFSIYQEQTNYKQFASFFVINSLMIMNWFAVVSSPFSFFCYFLPLFSRSSKFLCKSIFKKLFLNGWIRHSCVKEAKYIL